VLQIDHQPAGRPQGRADAIDVRHDTGGGGDCGELALRHEAVLQIDHHMGGALRVQPIEHPDAAALLCHPGDHGGKQGNLVHDVVSWHKGWAADVVALAACLLQGQSAEESVPDSARRYTVRRLAAALARRPPRAK
jgi:hypothetical protein